MKRHCTTYKIVSRGLYWFLQLILWAIFALIVHKAYTKFIEEPVGTEITYKVGNLQFPTVSICNWDFTKNELWKNCSQGQNNYIDALYFCLKENPDILNTIPQSWQEYSSEVHLKRTGKYFSTEQKIWIFSIHERFGPCFSFNGYKSQKFNETLKELGSDEIISLEFYLQEIFQGYGVILLHTDFDFPDAYEIHPRLFFTSSKTKQHVARLKLKEIFGLSTEKSPCATYFKKTCIEVQKYLMIQQDFKCNPKFIYSGFHIDPYNRYKNPCNIDKMNQILDSVIRQNMTFEECSIEQACRQTKYFLNLATYDSNQTKINILFEDKVVEYNIAFLSYDLQSLISEIGGTLGLTLGFSGLSLYNLVTWGFKRFLNIDPE